MKYGTIQGVDKKISRMVLGSTPFWSKDDETNFAIMDAYFALGGNATDTAHNYGPKCSGPIGRWMQARGNRDQMVLLDKGCHPYGSPRFGVEFMESDLKDNLERLLTDHVDVLVFHRDDPTQPLEPVIRRLNELRAEGKAFAWGGSNWTLARIEEGNRIAEQIGGQGFSLNNPQLTLAAVNEEMWAGALTADEETRAWHERTQMPLFSWASVASGFFAGNEGKDVVRVYHNETSFARKARAEELGKKLGLTATQVALAWVLNQPFPTFALTGCHSVDEVKMNAEAVEVELTPDQVRWLEHGD